ncbi:MAG: ATP-binding protein [Chloroflexi bacterium]|nr:MAG: ATP-binding protein [Chloroflexota bacterium]
MPTKHSLTVPGQYREIRQLCQFVMDGAKEAGLDETALFHVELACDEACTNIIEHGYQGEGKGTITVSWEIVPDAFVITIHDNGRAFDPDEVPPPPEFDDTNTAANIKNLKTGGLGLHFIRSLMDSVHYQFSPNGNTLTLIKKRPSAKGSNTS